jgi:hypothetical protein
MAHITLMTEAVLDCRMRGIYNLLLTGKYQKAKQVIYETIKLFGEVEETEVDELLKKYASKHLHKALTMMCRKKYIQAHAHIRDIHYAIEAPEMFLSKA